jgi:pyruvate,water dikinase
MKIWQRLSYIVKKPIKSGEPHMYRKTFRDRYQSFQELLSHNNAALELIAGIEEKMSGEFPLERKYVDDTVRAVAERVGKIIEKLNVISENKYIGLYKRFQEINAETEKILSKKIEIPVSRYTAPFDEITREMIDRFGNKNANLGDVRNRLDIPTPDGFAISTFAFKKFMDQGISLEEIYKRLSEVDAENRNALEKLSREIQNRIAAADMPEDISMEILGAYERLSLKYNRKIMVSVRSSAVHEDGEFSFAGQYITFLNISPELILQKCKEVIASLFSPKVISYYKTKGLPAHEMAMSVGILSMIDAKAAGVMYSRDPNNPKDGTLMISAVPGLCKSVVEGVVTPESYIISRQHLDNLPTTPLKRGDEREFEIIQKTIPERKSMLACRPDGEVEEVPLPQEMRGKPCLTDEQIKTLAEYAIVIEKHYQYPQDIEWAIDRDGRVFILQTRPLQMLEVESLDLKVPGRVEGYKILLDEGLIACKGIGFGKAYIVRTDEDMKNFPESAVLIAKHTSTEFFTVMNKTNAIITDIGGTTVHMATLARELRIPTLVDTEIATEVIKEGQEVTVDAVNCIVYEGEVKELIEFSGKRKGPFKNTQLFKTLKKVSGLVVPLNLIDPGDEQFRSESCKTMHDIARFAHQKAMQDMFRISAEFPEDIEAVKLVAGIPLLIYLIDLGDGIERDTEKPGPEHVRSIPFHAFLKGLTSLEWPPPRHIDVKGFLGMMAHTASITERELEEMGEKSFAFVSADYMNFSIRLGYHLSVVEAYAGEKINDNYIRFFFQGGGAERDRRMRRILLISEILKRIGFRIKVTEDIVDALITKYKRSQLKEKLEILGKLTVYTKQLDAIMYDDRTAEMHLEEFTQENIGKSINI